MDFVTSTAHLGLSYLDICTHTLDGNEFKSLLSESVELSHTTNDELHNASGKEEVAALFKKYIFNNTPRDSIDVKTSKLKNESEELCIVDIDVDENKVEADGINRYNFIEHTELHIRNGLIQKIVTVVKRTAIDRRSSI